MSERLTLGINCSFSSIVFSLRLSSTCCSYSLISTCSFGCLLTRNGRSRMADANLACQLYAYYSSV